MASLRHFLAILATGAATLAGVPAQADGLDEETTAVRFWEYANCALTRDKWRAEQMLSAPRGSDARKKATRDLAAKNGNCIPGGGQLRLTPGIMRDTVAGAYVSRYFRHGVAEDFVPVPELYPEARMPDASKSEARLAFGLRRFAECVSRKEFPMVASLLATKPYSEDETALFGQLGATMNSCIPVEQGTKLGFGRLDLRARLGVVAYELAAAAKLEPSNA
jgi:hypothetical protein